MGLKESNEITVKIKGELKGFYEILEKRGFKITHKFSMDDIYFVPEALNLNEMTTRDILAKAVLVRDIIGKNSGRRTKKLTFKIKNFDASGNILSQEAINCEVIDIEDAKKFLRAIGYKEIMKIFEDDIVYEKDGFEIAVKDIRNGDNLFEIETSDAEESNTIEKLIKKINKIELPIYTDNYFVKKAEVELDKIINNNKKQYQSRYYFFSLKRKICIKKQKYLHSNFNKDYKGKYFNLEKGTILAIGKQENIFIEKDINELTKISSIIVVCKGKEKNEPMTVDYIYKKWYRVISKKASEVIGKEFTIEYIKNCGSFELLQKIFEIPVTDALEMIKNKWDNEGGLNED